MNAETQTPAVEAKPRAPKLTASIDGKDQSLLRYPFPVKSPRFKVNFNGEETDAASTAGKGKAYTYFLYKNTSFYVPGIVAAGASVSVTFPEGYKFDDAQAPRVSNYKPKKVKKSEPEPATGSAAEPEPVTASGGDDGPKAKRRGR
jgi:hypothetical protein